MEIVVGEDVGGENELIEEVVDVVVEEVTDTVEGVFGRVEKVPGFFISMFTSVRSFCISS